MEQMEMLCNKICLLKQGEQLVYGETGEVLKNGEKTLKQLFREMSRGTSEKE